MQSGRNMFCITLKYVQNYLWPLAYSKICSHGGEFRFHHTLFVPIRANTGMQKNLLLQSYPPR